LNVTEFSVESFRGGNPLRFVDLGGGLNVALVKSGEGAAELLQVIPATLFGGGRFFSRDSSEVLPPVGRSALVLRGALGVFRVVRDWNDPHGEPELQAVDGRPLEAAYLADVLDGIGWKEYRDVFTFDLQKLAGLLRQPRRLRHSLRRMARVVPATRLESRWAPQPVLESADMGSIRHHVESLLRLVNHEDSTPSAESPPAIRISTEELTQQLDRVEQALNETRQGLVQVDDELFREASAYVASSVRTICSTLQGELRQPAKVQRSNSSDNAAQSALDRATERIVATQEELQLLRGELKEITSQIRELNQNNGIVRWIPHVEALMAHEKSLLREEDALEQLREKIEDLQGRVDNQKLEVPAREMRSSSTSELQSIARLEGLADRIREAEGEQSRLEQRVAQPAPAPLAAPLPVANLSLEDPVAIHQVERRITELRERLGFSSKYEELLEQRSRLEERVRDLYERRLPPPAMVVFFGVPFVAGLGMVIYALFANRPVTNWQYVGWGAVIVAATVIIKLIMDNQAAQDLDLARVDLRKVKDQLDRGEGLGAPGTQAALKAELRQAEQELRELRQRTVAPDALTAPLPRPAEGMSSEVLRGQLQDARRRVRDLGQQFRDILRDMDLSPTLTLAQAREAILARVAQASQAAPPPGDIGLPFQLQALRAEWERRREWLTTNRTQAQQIAQELGCQRPGESIAECFDVLRDAMRDHKERQQARAQLVKSYKRLRQRALRLRDQGRQLVKQRRKLVSDVQFQSAIAKVRQEQKDNRNATLRQQLEDAVRSLEETAANLGLPPQALNQSVLPSEAEGRFVSLRRRREELREFLTAQAEQLGGIRAQLMARREHSDQPSSDLPEWRQVREITQDLKRLCDLSPKTSVPSRQAISFAGSSSDLPVTLESASRYLDQLSGGAYRLVARNQRGDLQLETRQGEFIELGDMSRSHIANLYFALWLARIDAYSELGRRLPIVMHDPLGVTPPKRRGAVTRLLQHFAARGHQILLVTSSARHAKIMASKGIPVANLAHRERILASPASEWDHREKEEQIGTTTFSNNPIG
jgi:hypothetical protein